MFLRFSLANISNKSYFSELTELLSRIIIADKILESSYLVSKNAVKVLIGKYDKPISYLRKNRSIYSTEPSVPDCCLSSDSIKYILHLIVKFCGFLHTHLTQFLLKLFLGILCLLWSL